MVKTNLIVIFLTFLLHSVQAQRVKNKIVNKERERTKIELTEENKRYYEEHGVVRCATVEKEKALQQKYAGRLNTNDFENWLAPLVREVKRKQASSRTTNQVFNIPVVIHIIHDGDPVNTTSGTKTENISDAQAMSQIQVLNEDFRRMVGTPGGVNSTGVAVDVEINFVLAKTNPDGEATNGIIRHVLTPPNNTTPWTNDDWETDADVETAKINTQWDPNQYMNMWCFKFGGLSLNQGGMDGLLGFAQFPTGSGLPGLPSNEPANTDGVTAGYQYFGTDDEDDGSFIIDAPYNKGRTMTHEVGHFLGLRHIWGDTSSCGNNDYCADTPDATGSNSGCNKNLDSCPADGLGNDMVENYMDYTNDTCMDTFTADQKTRMIAVMENSPRRKELATSTTGQDPSPIVYFKSTNPTNIIEATSCEYTDVEYKVSIGKEPSQDTNITITQNSGNTDFEILNGNLVFSQGEKDDKIFTVRVYNDGLAEGEEEFTLSMTINANGGDASITEGVNKEQKIVINDNDFSTVVIRNITAFYDDFSDGNASDWKIMDNNSETADDWELGTENDFSTPFNIYTNYFMRSFSWNGDAYTPDNFLSTPKITLANGATNIELSYFAGSGLDDDFYNENYEVWVSTSITSVNDILNGTRIVDENLNAFLNGPGGATRTADLSAFAGQEIYISFRHHDTEDEWLIGIDNVKVTADLVTVIQSEVNINTPFEAVILASGKTNAIDKTTGNPMVDIDNLEAFNFGCVSAGVLRAGNGAQAYISNAANMVADKAFKLTSAHNGTASVTLDFYFTKEELEGWENETGQSRDNLYINRYQNGSTVASEEATVSTFGNTGYIISATFNGLEGEYYFGGSTTLSVSKNEIEQFLVYPNPVKDNLSVNLYSNDKVTIKLYNIVGREVYNKSFNNTGLFKQSINLKNINSGIYILNVTTEGKQTTSKIILE